ncbi:MAG: hypothetical protein Q4D39_06770, partial [Coriobacteriaceae bacterium]|nr:hypothetical protein [Coriobacteriaceae bacterium]
MHDVSEAVCRLTGIRSTEEELSDFNNAAPVSPLSIRISTAKSIEKAPADDDDTDGDIEAEDADIDDDDEEDVGGTGAEDAEDDDDFDELMRSVSEAEREASLLVINGP